MSGVAKSLSLQKAVWTGPDGAVPAFGSKTGTEVIATDWSKTPLGAHADWPEALKAAVATMLLSPQPMFLAWGPELISFFNDAYRPILGAKVEGAIGRPFAALWSDVWSDIEPIVQRALAGEGSVFSDMPLLMSRNGYPEQTWWSFSYTPLCDGSGVVRGVFCVTSETTEGVTAERQLLRSEARQRLLLQQMPGFVALLDGPDHVFEYVNDAYVAIFGARDFVGRDVRTTFPELHGRGFFESLDQVYLTGESISAKAVPMRLSGESEDRYIDYMYQPVRDDAGKVTGILVGGYEVTNRVQAEMTIRAERDQARQREMAERVDAERVQLALAAGAIIGTWVWDLPTDRFTVDEAFATAFGLDPALGRVGLPLAQIIETVHPDDQAGLHEAIGAVLKTGGPYAHQYRVRRRDGRYRWLEANGRVELDADGTPQRFPGVLLDVAARRREFALAELSEHVRTLDTSDDIAFAASETLGIALDVSRAAYGAIDATGRRMTIKRDWIAEGQLSIAGDHDFEVYGSYILALRRGEDVAIDDVGCDARVPDRGANFRPFDVGALVNLPLMERGRLKVVLCLTHSRPHAWTAGELAFARRVMDRAEVEIARRAAEHELRELNKTLEQQVATKTAERDRIWQLSGDMLGVADDRGVWLSINPAWTRILGWEPAEIVGRTSEWIEHPDDVPKTRAEVQRLASGLRTAEFENRFRTKDGDYRTLSWTAVPEDGLLYCVTRDVTVDRAQAAALADQAASRERTWRYSPDLLSVLDLPTMAFDRVNPAWTASLGWSIDEIEARSYEDFVHPDDVSASISAFEKVRRGEPVLGFENRYRTKDGGWRHLAWVALPDGNKLYSSTRDVTQEKEQAEALAAAEEALRQSQKMEAVGQLTGGLAHDFNNLLAAISGSLELMKMRIQQGRTDSLDRYMNGAQGATKRAAALTHRLLAFSRRQTLEPKPTDIDRLVAGMEDMVRRTAGPEIAVEIHGMADLWSTLVDPNQLENALLNLCINSRDAMPDGGRIVIETRNRSIGGGLAVQRDMPVGDYVSLAVSDDGVGMPPEVVERVFEPFFTTKPIGLGTGLGLSMIYGFAKQSGGQVRVHSEVGKGTTVMIFLPRHTTPEQIAQQVKVDVADHQANLGETVLVVDDEPMVRMLVVEILEDLGYRALEAGDGIEGLEIVRSGVRIDLLITDVGLPKGMNGRQLADAARTLRTGLKVLFITGYADTAVLRHDHLEQGMQVITKPFDLMALAKRIQEMIRD
ncbi:PAS domain-containing protein [Variovorax sp. RHLX14]|uniref:PAS domain-containing protein n=1 Tax=Variovorax sp. RHLX14 TaxID=1259731 RepID=UPI003F4504DA